MSADADKTDRGSAFRALRRLKMPMLDGLVIAALVVLYVLSESTEAAYDESVVLPLLVVYSLWVAYKYLTRIVKKVLQEKAFLEDNIRNFLLIWRYLWMGAGVVFLAVSLSGSIAALGLSAAFLGMVLGWSLQAPVTGIAAWLMIILKRPFRIGDRIIVSGITGDVVDINLTHVILNQVGGTVGGEEKSGRGVMIPNATLFQQVIHNYSYETKFLLDEVVVLITFRSDVQEAERILIAAASIVTHDIIEQTGQSPYVRYEIVDHGIRLRLRYQTLAVERQRLSSEITKIILYEIGKTYDRVEFAHPHMQILYRPKKEEA